MSRRESVEHRRRAGDWVTWLGPLFGFGILALLLAYWAAALLTGGAQGRTPFSLPIEQVTGSMPAPGLATWIVFALLVLIPAALLCVAAARWGGGGRRRRSRLDDAAARMGRGKEDLEEFLPAGARAKAERLRPGGLGKGDGEVGPAIGRTLTGRRLMLRQSWEDCSIDIYGPRRGKSSARAIPAILDAPGPVVATANKVELYPETWQHRTTKGRVDLYDPQHLIVSKNTPAACWYNPLTQVDGPVAAAELAEIWRVAAVDPDARTDEYFSPAGKELTANLMLAAAVRGGTLMDVYKWLLDPETEEPERTLADHGFELPAFSMRELRTTTVKQRDGVYGGPRIWLRPLVDAHTARWVTPGNGRQFDPVEFVENPNTLYLHSQKGAGSAAALVGSLVKGIFDAAKAKAGTMGRLDPSLLAVLDEVANVCRLPDLPEYYSHFGSRGINIMAFLQSYKQGRNLWGEHGMDALWGSATVRIYGGGEGDTQFLRSLAELIGRHTVIDRTRSVGQGPRGVTLSEHHAREFTLDVDDLGSLPKWRAVMFTQAGRPAMFELAPYFRDPELARVVTASKEAFTEALGTRTLPHLVHSLDGLAPKELPW